MVVTTLQHSGIMAMVAHHRLRWRTLAVRVPMTALVLRTVLRLVARAASSVALARMPAVHVHAERRQAVARIARIAPSAQFAAASRRRRCRLAPHALMPIIC